MTEKENGDCAAFGHELRVFEGRSMPCGWCGRMGPSPQTGYKECVWCRMCECCTAESTERKVCSMSGVLEPGEASPSRVSWVAGRWEVTLSRPHPDDGGGHVLCVARDTQSDSPPAKPTATWRVVYSPSPPELKLGDRGARHIASIPLPQQHIHLSDTLTDLVLLLNVCGVSHEVQANIDDNFLPLPHTYLGVTSSPVVSCVIAQRANYAVTSHQDRTVRLVEVRGAKKGRLLWTRNPRRDYGGEGPLPQRSRAPHQLVDLSVCLRYIAIAGAPSLLVHAMSGEHVKEIRASDYANEALSVSFSPCGRYLMCVASSHGVDIFKSGSGEHLIAIPSALLTPFTAGLWCCCFSAAGGYTAFSAEQDGQHGVVLVGQWRKSAPVTHFVSSEEQKGRTVSVQFDSQDRQLLCAGICGTVTIWNTSVGQMGGLLRTLQHQIRGGSMLVKSVFSGDSRISSVDSDGNRWYWDHRGLQTIVHNKKGGGDALCADFALRGRLVYGRSDGTVTVCGAPIRCGDPDPTHPHNSMNTRAVQRHAGQRNLLLFLLWQATLRTKKAELPAGVTILRQLEDATLQRIGSFVSSPYAGDDMEGASEQCVVM